MGSCIKTVLSVLLLFCSLFVFGQEEMDSLEFSTFEELFRQVNKAKTIEEVSTVANQIIKKAKAEDNLNYLIGGYQTHALIRNDDSKLVYCDSIINLKNEVVNPLFIADAYQLKADYYFNNNNFNKALDNYLIVSEYAKDLKDNQYIIKSKYDIGTLKRRINEKEEALSLYKESFEYSQNNRDQLDVTTYLSTITAIANIYNDMEQGDSSSYYNKLGIKEAKKYNITSYNKHFFLNEGVSLYYKKQYQAAIDSLEKHTPYYESKEKAHNLSHAYYYSGKAYQKLDNNRVAINYFKKVDSLFEKKIKVNNIFQKTYEELIRHYKQEKDLKNQLYYINQLIKVDSLMHKEELYLSKGIFKEYDIPKLESEKASILKEMNKSNSIYKKVLIIGIVLLVFSLIIIYYQHLKKTSYKKKFNAIMYSIDEPTPVEIMPIEKIQESIEEAIMDKPKEKKSLDISQEIVSEILEGLRKFEKEKEFLSQNITLSILAKNLKTNNNYLSKVINHYKKQSFSNYLNLLRIEYFIMLAKKDTNITKFTIKAIANDVGFSNAESFSKSFYKHKGIKPSYFLKELENNSKT